jgi:hypothetical protein
MMQLRRGNPHCLPAGRNDGGRAIQPFGDLAYRASPMPLGLLRQVLRLFDGGDQVQEAGLQQGDGLSLRGWQGVVVLIGTGPHWLKMDGDCWACIWWQIRK